MPAKKPAKKAASKKKPSWGVSPIIPNPLGTSKSRKGVQEFVFGDPQKGWKDVASTTALNFMPYGKIGKGVKAVVKSKKAAKAINVGGAIAAPFAVPKAINSLPSAKKASAKPVKKKPASTRAARKK